MKRWVFNIAALLSLVLFAAVVAVWYRSYWWDDQLQRATVRTSWWADSAAREERIVWFGSSKGKLAVQVMGVRAPEPRDNEPTTEVTSWIWSTEKLADLADAKKIYANWRQLFGFAHGSAQVSPQLGLRYSRYVLMPWWAVALIFAIVPVLWIRTHRRRRLRQWRLIRGLCRECGYDLRGKGGVCPECGMGVKTPGMSGV